MDLFGLREEKYEWLDKHSFSKRNYKRIEPRSPYYFLIRRNTEKTERYLEWKKISEIFPVNRDYRHNSKFILEFSKKSLKL